MVTRKVSRVARSLGPWLLLAAVIVFGVGLLPGVDWWRCGLSEDIRGELGAALIGGAAIGAAILVAERAFATLFEEREQEQDARDARQALRLQLGLSLDLQGVDLSRQDLTGFYLPRRNLEGAFLEETTLDRSDLENAVFVDAHMRQVSLDDADLSYADFRDAALDGASLVGALLIRANFHGADLTGADLTSSRCCSPGITDERLSDLDDGRTDFTQSILMDAMFADATLPGADFTGADLSRVDFAGADLRRADFGDATLTGADFAGANLANARFTTLEADGVMGRTARWDPEDPPRWPIGFSPPENDWAT